MAWSCQFLGRQFFSFPTLWEPALSANSVQIRFISKDNQTMANWPCDVCTFINEASEVTECSMCGTTR